MKKILYIDGQVFQSAAWDRGMGKYSLALLGAFAADKQLDYDKVHILFTKNLKLKSSTKRMIKTMAPNFEHVVSDLKVPDDPCQADIASLQKANEQILTDLVGSNEENAQIDFVVLSLFIDQVCSVFPSNVRRVLLLYDLIPFQYNDRYGRLCTFAGYMTRYRTLLQADIIWTISQTVADDAAVYLGISHSKLFNIGGAPVERNAMPKRPKRNLPESYLIMPSGNDLRKNNMRAVQGFESYRQSSGRSSLHLVITSFFDEGTKRSLEAYSPNLIFTGNVSEEELRWLFEHAEALLFVPEYEGLGLPILEAIEVGKPIICSNLSVFNEISETAFYYSDPYNPDSISRALERGLGGAEFKEMSEKYPDILGRFTWANTARKAHEALKNMPKEPIKKIKLAILAPSPSGYSAIGKSVMLLHPSMSEFFDIDYYLEQSRTHRQFSRPDYLPYAASVYDSSEFNEHTYRKYDAVLYHIGNSEFHLDTIKSALYLPGFAIFHDTHLTNIFEGELSTQGYISKDRLEAEQKLDSTMKNKNTSLITSIANRQLSLIAHSEYASNALKHTLLSSIPITKINLPIGVPKQMARRLEGPVTIGFAGIIHPAKGLDIIEAIAQSDKFYQCRIHIFGLSLVPDEVIRRLESYPNVSVDTDVTDFQFQTMLSQVNVLVNFRKDYRGETSEATLEAISYGAVPIVKKIGWYDEMPDDTVIKTSSLDEVIQQLEDVILNDVRRKKIIANGRNLVSKEFSYDEYAKKIYQLVSDNIADGQNSKLSDLIKQGKNKKILKRFMIS